MSVCFMTGHAEASKELLPQIMELAQRLIEKWNVTQFVVGHYGNFDCLAAHAIKQLKQDYPRIQLILLLPYYSADRSLEISNGFDGSVYPEGLENVPYRYAIVKANRLAIDGADHVRVSNQTRIRRKAGYFGAFCLARARKAPALLRPIETKIPRNFLALRSEILKRADFCSAAAKTQRILYVFASILTKDERKSAFSKRSSGLTAHPIVYQRHNAGNTYRLLKYAQRAEQTGKLRIWRV